jgi:hypothetical protein
VSKQWEIIYAKCIKVGTSALVPTATGAVQRGIAWKEAEAFEDYSTSPCLESFSVKSSGYVEVQMNASRTLY